MFRRGFGHFLSTAASLQWQDSAIDLGPDAAAWPTLPDGERAVVLRLLAGFVVGERAVASELAPFAAVASASDAAVAACFGAQATDEARHARFFERVLVEVTGTEPTSRGLDGLVEPQLTDLFERRLPATARALAAGDEQLDAALCLYHLLLEGVVFTAGQLALLDLLERRRALPGMQRGVELVLRDERWHIGFGASALVHTGARQSTIGPLEGEARTAVGAWGPSVTPQLGDHVLTLHRRRLGAAGLAAGAAAASPGAAYWAA